MNWQWLLNPFKKLIKKKSFWIILVVVIIIIIFIANLNKGKKVQYVTEKVKKGTLTQTVSETGTVESASAIDLNFKGTGTLKEIDVKEGAEVKANDVLAKLNAGSLEIQVKQAKANLDMAQANLNKLLAGASYQDIKVTQESVNNAKVSYESAKSDYDNLLIKLEADLKAYQENVDSAQTALTNAQNTYAKSRDDSQQTLITTIRSKNSAANTSLDFINYQYTNLGNIGDQQAKANTWSYYSLAKEKQTSLTNLLNKSDQSLNQSEISQATNLALGLYEDINNSLNSLFNTISSTIVDSRYFQTLIDSAKALVKNEQATDSANLAALQTADQAYKTAQLAYTSAVDTATATLTTNQSNLNSALANKDLQIDQAKAKVDNALGAYNLAKAQLDLKKAAPRQVDIQSYQAQVNQSKAALDLAQNNLNDYIIYAPKDGIITFINYKIGEQITFGGSSANSIVKPVISMLGKNDFQIKVDVPESDIIKVKVDNPVKITLDAYGSGIEFTGKVIYIDVAETLISDVVYYKVTVQLEPTDKEIKSGMTANVDILTAQKNNILFIPSRAVKETEDNKKYVEVKTMTGTDKIFVTTGLKGDQGRIEIMSGLKEGQSIIVYKSQ
jgi:RND family efflux transporter MFP subunit